jgi:cyclopropane fatty-acyl-phospholipid synthase-like methyltransferase
MLSTLGPHAKYSAYLRIHPTRKETIGETEVLMIENYYEKAKVEDEQDVLDVGCGWMGQPLAFLAQKYPNSKITGLSNSSTQKIHINQLRELSPSLGKLGPLLLSSCYIGVNRRAAAFCNC